MRTVRLGSQGLGVSAIGYGGAVIGGSYGPVDREQALAALSRAIQLGITFFDTADVYGNGLSESLIGETIGDHRTECCVATKVGMIRSADRRSTTINGRPEHIAAACDASLERLGIEAIDLYYLHRADRTVPIEETVGAMAQLVEAGKVRALGLCEVSAATVRRAHRVYPISACQMEYSLWCRDCEDEILPLCRELGIGLVAYCPLGRGFLAGAVSGAGPKQDMRARDPRFEEGHMQRNRTLLPPLQEIANRYDCTSGQLALAWLLAKGDDIVPIPGTRSQAHLEENAQAPSISLSDRDVTLLDELFWPGVVAGKRGTPVALARLGH